MQNFSTTSIPFIPIFRDIEDIRQQIDQSDPTRAADAASVSIGHIELTIMIADIQAGQGAYEQALSGYERARALIYELLYPTFEPDEWLLDPSRPLLPTGVELENALLEQSGKLLLMLRPEAQLAPVSVGAIDVPLPGDLQKFTQSGFQRSSTGDQTLDSATQQAVTLLADGKATLAADLLESALRQSADASQHATASTQLNLAVALLQSGKSEASARAAQAAQKGFSAAQDTFGVAQSLHTQAVAAWQSGDREAAQGLFTQVDELLQQPAAQSLIRGDDPEPRPRGPITKADFRLGGLSGSSSSVLEPLRSHDIYRLAVRYPGQAAGWQPISAVNAGERAATEQSWTIGVPVGTEVQTLDISLDAAPTGAEIRDLVYTSRTAVSTIADLQLRAVDSGSTTVYLTHLYAFGLLIKIGDMQYKLGLFAAAETSYLTAADYSYIHPPTEGLSLWIRLAKNILDWGNARYRAADLTQASQQYAKLIAADGTEPAGSPLYTVPSLAVGAAEAREVIASLTIRPMPPLQWNIAFYLLSAMSYHRQIADGLDFYGLALAPIHTFEYLQGVARGFAQEAIQAEREYINFRTRSESESATRLDLQTTQAMAWAEANARGQQYFAAQVDEAAAQQALTLAIRRRDDAVTQRDAYAASSWTQIWSQAASTAQGMGSNSYFSEISALADKLDRGESISGDRGLLAAAYVFQAGRRNRDYELARMQDNINQLNLAIPVAQLQVASAAAVANAAEIAWQAAIQRAQFADAALAAFDAEEFTSQTWNELAEIMEGIAEDYLWRAIRMTKLMERAYNFDFDTNLGIIKDEYGHANPSGASTLLLGGASLLEDIDSFGYRAVVNTVRKSSRIKDVVSLAGQFPAQFQEFLRTGLLSMETDLYEFDRLHPGFYQQRIEAVEIQFIGLIPAEGINGTLSVGGVSRFRQRDGEVGQRVHQVDTLALSDFVLRNDLFVYPSHPEVRGLFQGMGLGTTWELHLPKRSNNFDYARIIDVQFIVYYTAIFDLALRQAVLARPARPGELVAVRNLNLRFDAPDAWYGFYQNNSVTYTLDPIKLPANHREFSIVTVHLRVQTQAGITPAGVELSVTAPGQSPKAVTTNADGVVDFTAALPALTGASPLGDWQLTLTGGPSVSENGQLKPERVVSIQLGLEYGFSYPEEA